MAVGTGVTTADELFVLPDDAMRHELLHGEHLVMAPAGAEHGRVSAIVGAILFRHVSETAAGVTFGAETGFRLADDTVLAPDAAFVNRRRAEEVGAVEQYWPGPPDLAVEIVSPTDQASVVSRKVDTWLRSGCGAVLVLAPRHRTATVHRPAGQVETLGAAEIVDLDDVVPGFHPKLADLFT